MRSVLFFIWLVLLSPLPAIAAERAAEIHRGCTLRMGVSDWPPYQLISSDGVVHGKQIELINKIFAEVGCKIVYEQTPFPQGLSWIENGQIDVQMNASQSEDRSSYAHFSIPYRNEFLLLYANQNYYAKCRTQSLESLIRSGFKLAVQKGLVYGDILTNIQNDPELNQKLIYVESNIQHVGLMESYQLDGVIDDPVVVAYRSTINATGSALRACPIVVSSAPISMIFSKKTVSDELVERINAAIRKVQATEYYQQKWVW